MPSGCNVPCRPGTVVAGKKPEGGVFTNVDTRGVADHLCFMKTGSRDRRHTVKLGKQSVASSPSSYWSSSSGTPVNIRRSVIPTPRTYLPTTSCESVAEIQFLLGAQMSTGLISRDAQPSRTCLGTG